MSKLSKIAFIGTHGVGKTTCCYDLAARLKTRDISLEVVGEIARRCPLPINKGTTVEAQSWILHTQIAEEILAAERHDLVICDRSVLDNFVYLLISTGSQPHLEALVDYWVTTYDLLVHVPITEDPRPDGLRSTDPSFQQLVENRLMEEVDRRGLDLVDLTDLDRTAWGDRVEARAWAKLEAGEQMKLL